MDVSHHLGGRREEGEGEERKEGEKRGRRESRRGKGKEVGDEGVCKERMKGGQEA